MPMKEGDVVTERKHPNGQCKILRVAEKDDKGKAKSFVVSFCDDKSSKPEYTLAVTKLQRLAKGRKILTKAFIMTVVDLLEGKLDGA